MESSSKKPRNLKFQTTFYVPTMMEISRALIKLERRRNNTGGGRNRKKTLTLVILVI